MDNNEKGIDLSNAVDKRDYPVKLGLARPGRGRFSRDAKEALAEAEKNGVIFIDKNTVVGSVKTVGDDGKIVEVKREVNPWAQHAAPIREGILMFKGKNRFKLPVNSSETCESCKFSFGWCYCEVPTFRYWKTGELLSLSSN